MARYLALDIGAETIGLAAVDTSDEAGPLALYTVTRLNRRRDLARVAAEAEARSVDALVVGLALLADGSEGSSARRARRLGELLAEQTGLPVYFQDETLTSFEAEGRLRAQGYAGQALADRLDAEAARVILEEWLAGRG